MKSKKAYLIVILLFSFQVFSQEQTTRINFILLIDDRIVQTGVYDGFFLISDSLNKTVDSIAFSHEVGDLILKPEGYLKLTTLPPGSKVIITFKYSEFCSTKKEYRYLKETSIHWLIQRYVIFKVYNFTNKKNHKHFRERQGYGIEIYIPANGLSLPRKRIKKVKDNCY